MLGKARRAFYRVLNKFGQDHRPSSARAIQRLLNLGIPVESVLDVGVLSGTGPLMELFPHTHHHLFEPEAAHYDQIEEAYRTFPHTLHKMGLSDADGEATLAGRTIDGATQITHSHIVIGEAPFDALTFSSITMRRLDTASAELSGPFLLKIDVDGHEMPILRGATETLAQTNIVMIEAPVSNVGIPPILERASYLIDRGFMITDIVDPMYYDGILWQVDVILTRSEFADRFVELRPFDYARGFRFDPRKVS